MDTAKGIFNTGYRIMDSRYGANVEPKVHEAVRKLNTSWYTYGNTKVENWSIVQQDNVKKGLSYLPANLMDRLHKSTVSDFFRTVLLSGALAMLLRHGPSGVGLGSMGWNAVVATGSYLLSTHHKITELNMRKGDYEVLEITQEKEASLAEASPATAEESKKPEAKKAEPPMIMKKGYSEEMVEDGKEGLRYYGWARVACSALSAVAAFAVINKHGLFTALGRFTGNAAMAGASYYLFIHENKDHRDEGRSVSK